MAYVCTWSPRLTFSQLQWPVCAHGVQRLTLSQVQWPVCAHKAQDWLEVRYSNLCVRTESQADLKCLAQSLSIFLTEPRAGCHSIFPFLPTQAPELRVHTAMHSFLGGHRDPNSGPMLAQQGFRPLSQLPSPKKTSFDKKREWRRWQEDWG